MSTSRLTGAALGLLAALALTGCAGSAAPGVAATVGEETIRSGDVDSATAHMCTALADQFQGQAVPMGFVRQGTLQLLVLREQSRQIAEEYGVRPSTGYSSDLAERTQNATRLPEDVREDYIEVMTSQSYAQDILEEVGEAKLMAEGIAEPTVEEAQQAGADVFDNWPGLHGIEVDPRYGVELEGGALSPVDTNVSFALSESAIQGLEAEPDPSYANSLPATQRCGG